MAYIGKTPVNGFHSKQSLTGDGSTTSFALDYTVADPSSLIVSVGVYYRNQELLIHYLVAERILFSQVHRHLRILYMFTF